MPVVPVCYRHPGRETYISCTRCERPICPDCMVSAAVGFQCPECVRAGATAVREGRTRFGGRVHRDQAVVTKTLIGLCLAAFVAQVTLPWFTARMALLGVGVAGDQWWRLVTAGFLHGSLMHLAFNMLALWVVGPNLEAVLGRTRFLALYLTSLVAGSAVSYAFSSPLGYSLGASGAVFGLFGATIVVLRRMRRDAGPFVGIVAINLLLPLLVPNIDWRAHVGGLVAGAVVAAVLVYAPRQVWRPSAVGVVAVLLAVSGLVVVQRSADIRDDPRFGLFVPAVSVLEQQINGNPL